MHEMSLAEGVLQIIEDSAKEQSFSRVKTVWLEIGQLAGVEVEAMRFCFDAVVRDSIAQDAKLEIIETPGQAWCLHCAEVVHVQALFDACPKCGSYQVQVTGGNEMRVKELDVE
ncbi:hydrogenase maturation nickel metallochaperone HypA [Sideroxydans lithotrophicus]|jgi:hydrogenase nickel incorporation protein HypA/HybF|uniref:Hydrogenase maturation factor HypA n=1 Tax=Sideroxydans lithotrophicus (strain ES-1) TaxID=580332 RepID=D5CMH8_SIDLE|nr:hydrogenase maturation nickel metallochaperone HypA [Sideroxydans lithotrophicus]ADE12650.1 hydrogenase nickel insertion protein HypA [Sideroxydans lithotrophicus ES-1]